jgi:stage II sporulation protein D
MTTIAVAAGAVAIIVGDAPGASAAPEVVTRPASGIWIVDGHGYGHGRGMSQYGARAQAAAGRSAEQILAFYYPGTVRSRIGNPTIRVLVNDGDDPFVQLRPSAGLRVSWTGHSVVLPATTGGQRWQVGKWGTTFRLRYLATGGWHWWGGSLPSSVTVTDSRGILPVVWNDGSRTDYRTSLVVTRTGATSAVVNRLPMELYLRGVVPRESPSYWPAQALRAQAVAARTYAYSRIRSPLSVRYDICATTACQVYGGVANYRSSGSRISGEVTSTTNAVGSTGGIVLTVAGRPIVSEYSASNGGWTASGGRSYLPAKRDPYTSGDPFANWSVRVRVADVAARFGFRRLDRVQVTQRDGAGAFGGRLLGATITGIDGVGKPRSVAVSGSALRNALGVRSNYLRLRVG